LAPIASRRREDDDRQAAGDRTDTDVRIGGMAGFRRSSPPPPATPTSAGAAHRDRLAREFADRPLGIAGEFATPGSSPPPPPGPPAFVIPPPDWAAEERERKQREQRERTEQARRLLAEKPLEIHEDTEARPAKRKLAPATPNLDKVRAQLADDRGETR
jgi:hypothetical protein